MDSPMRRLSGMPRMGSPYDCTKDEDHSSCEKLVEEVMVVETNCKEFNGISFLDVFSEKEHLQDTPVDWFVEEIASRDFCASCGGVAQIYFTFNLVKNFLRITRGPLGGVVPVHLLHGHQFVRKLKVKGEQHIMRWQTNLLQSFQIPIIILRHPILITPMHLRNMTSHWHQLFV